MIHYCHPHFYLRISLILDDVHGVLADVDDCGLNLGVGEPTGQLRVAHDLADDILGLEAKLIKLGIHFALRSNKKGPKGHTKRVQTCMDVRGTFYTWLKSMFFIMSIIWGDIMFCK